LDIWKKRINVNAACHIQTPVRLLAHTHTHTHMLFTCMKTCRQPEEQNLMPLKLEPKEINKISVN